MKKARILTAFLLAMLMFCTIVLTACPDPGEEDPMDYTYNTYISKTPDHWNAHIYESSEQAVPLDYLTMGLYDFVLNEDKDGYDIIPEMAADLAVDVTDDYVGEYGVAAGDSGKVWKVTLNQAAKWQTGEAIKAADYVYSLEQLISSQMKNYRHTVFTTGDGELFNAAYYNVQDKVGETDWQAIRNSNGDPTGVEEEGELYVVWEKLVPFLGGGSVLWYAEQYHADASYGSYFNPVYQLYVEGQETTRVDNNSALQAALNTMAAAFGVSGDDAWKLFVFVNGGVIPEVEWEDVGFWAEGDYTIYFATVNPVEEFYFYYSVVSFPFLVHQATYEACKSEASGVWSTTYHTSIATTVAWGPYKLTSFVDGQKMVYEKNDQWYGWTDGKHEGQYQTTRIVEQVIAVQATALNAFLIGQLDDVALASADVPTYRSSSQYLVTPQTYTTKLTMNSDYTALKARETDTVNKTLLSYEKFRKAIALSINKAQFVSENVPVAQPAFGLINYLYVYDYNTGARYRDTDAAKKALVDYYGLTYGSGGTYATLDAAYDALTGYDKAEAARLFVEAFEEATAAGDWKATHTKVSLEFLQYANDVTYVNMYNFVKESVEEALVGTAYEGKVEITREADEDYYDVMAVGETDMILATWGGGQFDPFGTISVYLNPDSYELHEYGANIDKLLTLTVPGETTARTLTLREWDKALNGVLASQNNLSYKNADVEVRLFILAALEKAFMDLEATVTLYYRYSATMHSYKINYATTTYVNLVGYGGLRFMTYNYTDMEWAAWVAQRVVNAGDVINYKLSD